MASPSTPPAPPATPPTSPPSRPASPSPSRSNFRTLARMGTMLRRNSSGLGFGKTLSKSESKSSLRGKEPSQESAVVPDTVPESPIREAAAVAAESTPPPPVGPSPLSVEVKAAPEASPAPVIASVLSAEPESLEEAPLHPPAPAPVPAPVVPPAAAPVSAPAPVTAPAPSTVSVPASAPAPASAPTPAPAPAPVPAVVAKPEPVASAVPPQLIPQKHVVVVSPSEEIVATPQPEPQTMEASRPAPPPAVEERAPDYFAWSNIPENVQKKPSTSTLATNESVPAPISAPAPAKAPVSEPLPERVTQAQTEEAHIDPYVASAADSFAWKDENIVPSSAAVSKQPSREQLVASPQQSVRALSKAPSREVLPSSPPSVAVTLSPKASKSSLASSYGQVVTSSAGRRRVSVSVDPEEGRRGRSRSRTSIRVSFDDPYADPFADPPAGNHMAVPKHALSPVYSVNIPDSAENSGAHHAEETEGTSFPFPEPTHENYEESIPETVPTPIAMPLPALNEVMSSRVIREQPSAYSIGQSTVGPVDHAPRVETDERLPLLPRMPVPNVGTSKASAEPPAFNDVDITVHQSRGIIWPSIDRSFRSLGWAEHVLPDSSLYYSNRDLRVTTEVDLRNAKKLDGITDYLDKKRPHESALPPPGWELWIRDNSKLAFDFIPIRSWISHQDRILTLEPPTSPAGEIVSSLSDDDRVNMEYRYWTYVESHPAHEPLPANAHAEALDALTWCYTDCLLPSERTIPPAFSPQECQELMTLLRSDAAPNNAVVRTRIVARVLLRQAQWRQHYFRPTKPLPNEFNKGPIPSTRRVPFRRAFADVIMSILCLGIPYLFMDRSSRHHIDEESGMRSQGPVLIIGACACLVAAVILSASVTLMTLPGLDDIARLAGMIAILFSASSMVSSVVALFKFKADVERTVVYIGGEGLMVLSRRSIIMSLPVVFLAWAIAAFITGITFYSFRGVTLTSKAIIAQPFVDYTHWVVVGGLGALVGVLLVSALIARR